ncbi:hypothetical protein [Rhizobium sp. RU36D]|uniref:hypothetical protein n=1 Tax=Rhizobium sp. RU36D TaxID=1907415 RepID=UPI0009D8C4AB|nr:hypothetical protein [Rhizobium sp. RU36D]SMD19709.1 hypothetical protein SAMN05880593_14312 [Rhizobium sp. RU36D]
MAKAILTTKVDPTYDDLPEQRYHFPRTYLRQVEAARGDWIVYYEPRRPSGDLMKTGGKQAYFATARIVDIIADPSKADHFYALIEDFLPFDHAVPFKEADHYYEIGLRKKDGSTNKGAFGRAVRNIPMRNTIRSWLPASHMCSASGIGNVRRPIQPKKRASASVTIRRCHTRSTASTARSSLRSCSVRSGTGRFP